MKVDWRRPHCKITLTFDLSRISRHPNLSYLLTLWPSTGCEVGASHATTLQALRQPPPGLLLPWLCHHRPQRVPQPQVKRTFSIVIKCFGGLFWHCWVVSTINTLHWLWDGESASSSFNTMLDFEVFLVPCSRLCKASWITAQNAEYFKSSSHTLTCWLSAWSLLFFITRVSCPQTVAWWLGLGRVLCYQQF